ncbi:GNAT family N-acetyltransferase [Glycomyces harbinensis]|uniref:Protein N-acetyltransferase, RimJ/RimL family n=1 Tax=Glycomyces harbinensis TaxID=58114 RepID=A0A1G6QQ30_9ACTN|nr:GNAT family protein [Glycomyces harbinensis]SDC93767.1 Protein N-acetyltransferase, RimJ/RimL family [Glycomyces harbinensis]
MFKASLGEGAELRPLVPSMAEEFAAHMDRGREFIGRYVSIADVVADAEAARKLLETYAEKAASDTGRIWGIWLDEVLVGGVLFRTMDFRMETAEAGCWLEPAAVGKGLVTRGVAAIIDWAVEVRGIHRVDWWAATGNTASIAVAKRLGMTREGVIREAYLHRGVRYDMEGWSVLAPEWRAAKGA